MDWIGWAFVLGTVLAAVGVVLERRRRATRLGGPEHSQGHRAGGPDRHAAWQDEPRPTDHRLGGYVGG